MIRGRGRRRKPKVYWMQDTRELSTFNLASSVSTTSTTVRNFLTQLSPLTFDPAGSLAAGLNLTNPRTQLLTEGGWRMIRCVGELTLALEQTTTASAEKSLAPLVQVEAGLFLGEIDEQGAIQNATDWHLPVPVQVPDDDASRAAQMEGEQRPWIWRRSWLLQNFDAGVTGSGLAQTLGDEGGVTGQIATGTFYDMGFSCNSKYQSIHLGAHFDIKRHVTFKRNQAPFWALGAYAVDYVDNSGQFTVRGLHRYRTLIARPGRAWKDER